MTKIGVGEKAAYGLGDFASQLMYTPVGSLLIYYYTEYIDINIATIATIMLVSRIFDGFSDILVGWLIEKTNSPYGKSRVWILRMLIPFFIGTVLLFSVPTSWGDTAKLIYVFFSYNIAITVVYTAINMPYGSMATSISPNSYERSIIVIWRMLLATAGSSLATATTLPLVRFFGDDARAWTYTFIVLMTFACACFFITFFFCHERVQAPHNKEQKLSLKTIGAIFKNKYWCMLVIAMITIFSADMVCGSANVYFCKYFLDNPDLIGVFAVITNVTKIGSMIIILPFLIKSIGKNRALIIACLLVIASFLMRYLAPTNLVVVYSSLAIMGFAQGFTYACCFAMIPDTVEYSEYLDNERHEGIVYAGASFGTKLAAGLGAIIPGFVLNLGGYVNNAPVQTDAALTSILLTHTLVPMLLYIIAIIALCFYKLDKIYPDVIKELGIRHARKAVMEN